MKKSVPSRRPLRFRAFAAAAASAALLSPLPGRSQEPPRPAEIVEDAPPPATPPKAEIVPDDPAPPPRAEIIPEGDETKPEPVPAETNPPPKPNPAPPKAAPKPDPPAPAAPKEKSKEDELFDYCEQLFARGNFAVAIRQYGEYQQAYPRGKYREEARFKIAESHYSMARAGQGSWDNALLELDGFLRDFPSARGRSIALYHAGESHRNLALRPLAPEDRLKMLGSAGEAYRAVLRNTKSGTYAAYAAFRLASFAYQAAETNSSQYATAIRYFAIAAAQAPKDQSSIRFASLYFGGLSSKFSGSVKDATASFEEVIRVKEGNEYYEKALNALAQFDLDAGRTGAAMKKFEILAKEGRLADMRADSMVKAGMIQANAGNTEDAVKFFEKALAVPGAATSLSLARYGLIFAYYKVKDYDKVVATWRGMSADYSQLEESRRAQLLLIVGTCYAATSQHVRAVEVFQILELSLPSSPEAVEGGYKRLVSLFKLNDPRVTDEVKDFVERWREAKPDSDYLDKAWLVRAAYYYNRGLWEAASETYAKVREGKLDAERLATYQYQRGFAESSSGSREALATLTSFLTKNPEDNRVPMALLQRGVTSLKFEDLSGSLKDFETIAAKYPQSDAAESAAYYGAKVKGKKLDYAGMVADFQKFLTTYPDTKAAAEAHFWIGAGLYHQQKYADCLTPLRTARQLNTQAYYTDASQMLIIALSQLKDIDPLMVEVDAYLKGTQETKIQSSILLWLGHTVFRDRHDYHAAARYLTLVVDRENPAATRADIWAELGESYLESGNAELALMPLDNSLTVEAPPLSKARSHLLKARALFALRRLEEATGSAEAGLDIDKESLVSAQLRLVLGDVAMASKRYNEAISSYGLVMGNWEDGTITPMAMEKYIAACEASGVAANRTKAAETREQLKKRFPRYQATVTASSKP